MSVENDSELEPAGHKEPISRDSQGLPFGMQRAVGQRAVVSVPR